MRSAVRSPEASVRTRGGCISCSRFGAAKQLCGDTEQAKLAEYPAYLHQNKKSFRKEWLFCFAGNEGREKPSEFREERLRSAGASLPPLKRGAKGESRRHYRL